MVTKEQMVATRRKVSNPLALAVMALLYERPMHPYEMVTVMRERAKHEAIRLRYSSLYSVVEALQREALIQPLETVREGRRPERTVYGLTDEGRVEFLHWLRELLSVPSKEYTQFAAGLSFLAALPPGEAVALLRERTRRLEGEVEDMRRAMDAAAEEQGVARLFLIENEHELVLREAELGWVRGLVREIEAGTLDGLEGWKAFHRRGSVAAVRRGEEDA
jgi:DNA-binding PadR family transcriptional regulator